MKLAPTLIALLLLAVAFFIVDCGAGHVVYADSRVTDQQYKPAWTSSYWTHDKHGSHCHTTYHPEEWHVYAASLAGQEFDVETTHSQYTSLTNRQPVWVRFREGKWTGISYVSRIEPYTTIEK